MFFLKSSCIEMNYKETEFNMKNYPIMKINNDEDVALLFMEAITKKSTDHAKRYVSKNYVDSMDFNELKDFFDNNNNYKLINKINFGYVPKNCKTNSMIFIGSDKKGGNIINVHMICEPDKYSKWKIYAFDEES